LKIKD